VKRWLAGVVAGVLLLVAAGCGEGDGAAAVPSGAATHEAPESFGAFKDASLIVISLDTLRADDTTMNGAAELTPTLAELARESIWFENARAQAPHTAPSHMSLFTSTLPSVHDVQNVSFNQELAPDEEKKAIIQPARGDVPTLAEVLKASGFQTVGLTDGGNLNPPHGFSRGFDTYTYDLQGAAEKVQLGEEWVGKLASSQQRFFLFWHTYQIHSPYCPPQSYVDQWAPKDYQGFMRERIESLADKSFKERWAAKGQVFWKEREKFGAPEASFLRGVYRAGIRYTDDELDGLLRSLRSSGVLDRSILVILSDHGEEFFEHGHWQHEDLYEECLRVPLMVRLPGGRNGGKRIRTPVALVDVMPTALELLGVEGSKLQGLPGPVRHAGISLAETLLTGKEPHARPIISELIATRSKGGDYEKQVAIYANGMTYLYDKVRAKKDANGKALRDAKGKVIFQDYLFDLSRDPGQKSDLVGKGGAPLEAFHKLLESYETLVKVEMAGAVEQAGVEMTPEMIEQLKSLSYVHEVQSGAASGSTFAVELQPVEAAKQAAVLKALEADGLGGPEAATLMAQNKPCTVKSGLTREEAEALVASLEAAGGHAQIVGN
jgi:choline-sulfatase